MTKYLLTFTLFFALAACQKRVAESENVNSKDSSLNHSNALVQDTATHSAKSSSFDINSLEGVFLIDFRHSPNELLQKYGRPENFKCDTAFFHHPAFDSIVTLNYSRFSVSIGHSPRNNEYYLRYVKISDSTMMAKYGFVKGTSRRSLEHVITMSPEIYNEQEHSLELEHITNDDLGRRFHFTIRDNKLEAVEYTEYIDE